MPKKKRTLKEEQLFQQLRLRCFIAKIERVEPDSEEFEKLAAEVLKIHNEL